MKANEITPETDHLEVQLGQAAMHSHPILWEHGRRMERDRDEARDIGEKLSKQGLDMMDENRSLKRERYEVLAQVKELIYIAERAIALAEIDFENDKFGVLSELRDQLEKIREAIK